MFMCSNIPFLVVAWDLEGLLAVVKNACFGVAEIVDSWLVHTRKTKQTTTPFFRSLFMYRTYLLYYTKLKIFMLLRMNGCATSWFASERLQETYSINHIVCLTTALFFFRSCHFVILATDTNMMSLMTTTSTHSDRFKEEDDGGGIGVPASASLVSRNYSESETEDEEVKMNCIGGFRGFEDSDMCTDCDGVDGTCASEDQDDDDDGEDEAHSERYGSHRCFH
jgi:hypothetical protein